MFGLSNLQIYGLQPSTNNNETANGMEMTANFLEKLIRNELLVGTHNYNHNNGFTSDTSKYQSIITNGYDSGRKNEEIKNADDKENNNNELNENGANIQIENASNKEHHYQINSLDKSLNMETVNEVKSHTNSETTANLKTISTKTNGELQRKKLIQTIAFLDQNNQRLQIELAKEKRRRNEELSKIIKSLFYFESKLKHDKKQIYQKLYEKDKKICKLIHLNKVLQMKLGAQLDDDNLSGGTGNIGDDDDIYITFNNNEIATSSLSSSTEIATQFCPNCRKEYYCVEQTPNEGDDSGKDEQTEHGSSSDETVSSSFYGARRSIRYTSKRTFGTFRNYMKSRCMLVDDTNFIDSEVNKNTLCRDENQYDNNSNISCEKTKIYSKSIDNLHGIKRVESFEANLDSESELQQENGKTNSNLLEINSKQYSSSEKKIMDDELDDDEFFLQEFDGKSSPILTVNSNNNINGKQYDVKELSDEISSKEQFETSTDNWYASASDAEDNDDNSVRKKLYTHHSAVNPVLECVNQILLQQSMGECLNDGPPSLESKSSNEIHCGNGSISSNTNKENTPQSNAVTTVTRKHVHFATKNSMVYVPRDDLISSPIPQDFEIARDLKENNFNYESIYSNEYEPVGSERNSSSLYVDMESKLEQDDRAIIMPIDKPTPPALPPKPANLLKIRRILRAPSQSPQQSPLSVRRQSMEIADDKSELEPDYCSISEVNEAITNVQITVDVHNPPPSFNDEEDIDGNNDENQSDYVLSQKNDEEIFADIPKLPNVAAIMAPKAISKFINNENYITKSSSTTSSKDDDNNSVDAMITTTATTVMNRNLSDMFGQQKPPHVPKILVDIHKKPPTIPNTLGSASSPKTSLIPASTINSPNKSIPSSSSLTKFTTTPTKTTTAAIEYKLPLQAEFDWYNLDAEYGHGKLLSPLNQPDVIKATDLNGKNTIDIGTYNNTPLIDKNNPVEYNLLYDGIAHSIEYNLDEEFSLSSQPPDIIKENTVTSDVKIPLCMNHDLSKDTKVLSLKEITESTTTTATTPRNTTTCDNFPTIVDPTPSSTRRIKLRADFTNFIENSGLSTKPLPRQRKIYFSGPFV